MDNAAKSALLQTVVEYAKLFQTNRRRKKMSAQDIHNAIHALGLQPLYSSIEEQDTVNTTEYYTVSAPVAAVPSSISKVIAIVEGAGWVATSNNFQKRKLTILDDMTELSVQTRFYVKYLVNHIANGKGECPLIPPSNSDVQTAAWYLGLFLTDLAAQPEGVHWLVVRSAVWYLEKVIGSKKCLSWRMGLDKLASGTCPLIGCESIQQETLIRKVCQQMYAQI